MKRYLCFVLCFSFQVQAIDHEGIDWEHIRRPSRPHAHHALKAREWESENHPRNRPVPFKINSYALDIQADPISGTLSGKTKIAFTSRSRHLESITIDAYDMKIESVHVSKELAKFRYNGETIFIVLKHPLNYHQKGEIDIAYSADRSQSFFQVSPNIINPARMKTAYTFTQPEDSRKWFPCIDRPLVKAPFEIKVSVPEDYKVLSNGTLLSQIKNNKQVQFHYKMEEAISPYLVSLAIGPYEILSLGDFQGKPLTLWTPPSMKKEALFDTARTGKMMEIISEFSGLNYPFASYAQSIAPSWEVSMEHQGASTLGAWVITGDHFDEATVVHELAHQWFGNWLTPETWGDLWLSEGFASYIPFVFYKETHSHNKALGELDDWREGYFHEAQKTSHALSPLRPDLDSMFDAHAYEKGALVIRLMHYVANLIPSKDHEENFKKSVKHYVHGNGQKTVRHTDLQWSLETITGESWQIFFDQWVRSPGHPKLEVEFENDDDEVLIKVKQKQAFEGRGWPSFQFPITVDLYAENGKRVRRVIELYDGMQEVRLETEFAVASIDLDPDWDLPAEIQILEDVRAWLRVLKFSPSETAQIRAMRNILSKNGIAEEALLELILQNPSLYLKADALDKLSKKTENEFAIERIIHDLESRKLENDPMIRNALAAAKAWLSKIRPGSISENDEKKLQEEFLHAHLSVIERKSILEKLSVFSLPHALAFGIERLKEAQWSMRDRRNILELICKHPSEQTLSFLKEALQTSSHYWFNFMVLNLLQAKYEHPDLVPILLERAKKDRMISVRHKSIDLLAIQKASKAKLCPELLLLQNVREDKPDRLEDLRTLAHKAYKSLECVPAVSTD